MAFVQVIDFHTDRIDEGQALVDEYFAKTAGKRTAQRGMLCRDRDDPTHYLNLVFFDSYESAMENSQLPETNDLSGKLATLMDGPPTFRNLDVIEERS